MQVKDWNENFTAFVIDSINKIKFPYVGGEKGILPYYNFSTDNFCTKCWLSCNYLAFQTVFYIDFEDDIEARVACIERMEAYIREAFNLGKRIKLLSRGLHKSVYYGEGYKLILKFKIDKNIQNKLITLAKMKGFIKGYEKDVLTKNIFDKENIDNKMLNELGIKVKERILSSNDCRILELFKIANKPLSLTELVIGYYNKYSKPLKEPTKNKNYMGVVIYRLVKRGILEPIGRGTYKLKA